MMPDSLDAKVEELCAAGFRPNRMFPRFDQQAFSPSGKASCL